MAIEVFKLFGSIMVNNDEANKSIAKTDEKAEGLGSKFVKGVGTAAKWGAAIVGAAGAGGAALLGLANKASQTADRVDKLSNKIGISKKGFQEWDYVLAQNGMDVEKLQVGVKTLTSKMEAAASGTKGAAESFSKLGLEVTDANGKLKSQEDMMNESIMALASMENGTEKARLATELFGKAGQEMMPMLNNGAQGIEDLKNKAHELGLVMSDEAVSAGVLLGDTMDDVKKSFGSIVTKIGVEVMPIIQKFLEWVLQYMPVIQEVFSVVFDVIGIVVQTVGETIGRICDFISEKAAASGITWEEVWTTCTEIFNTFVEVLQFYWDTVGQPLFELIVSIIGWVKDIFAQYWPMISGFFTNFVQDCKVLWEEHLKPMFEAIGNFISTVLAPAFEFVFKNIIGPVVGSAFKLIIDLWNNSLKPILTGIIDFITGVFTGNWSQAWGGLGDIVSGVFGGLISLVKAPLNIIIEMVNKMINGLNKLTVPDWVPFIGGGSINIPNIPMLAKGTDYFSGSAYGNLAIVGEQGPELVNLPTGSRVNTAKETEDIVRQNSKENIFILNINGREFIKAVGGDLENYLAMGAIRR